MQKIKFHTLPAMYHLPAASAGQPGEKRGNGILQNWKGSTNSSD